MRKWMRERLQRRKKKASEPAPEAKPLQPAYFDEEGQSQPAAAASSPEADTPSAPEPESEAQPDREESAAEQPAEKQQASSSAGAGRGRGRRRRGGRGRGGRVREQAVAQAFAPAAGKGTIPEVPAAGEEASSADEEPETEASVGTVGELEREAAPEAEPVAASPQAPAVPGAVPMAASRPPKGIVVLAIGLPGSGKSTWFKRHNVTALSSDMVRSLLFDDIREQRFQDLVFSNLRSMLKARLIAKRPMNYVDATNLTPHERQHWIKLAKDYNYEVHAVFFDVPLEVCIERHNRRDRVVPEDVMRRMAAKLKPPSFSEGFAKITVVRVKKKAEN